MNDEERLQELDKSVETAFGEAHKQLLSRLDAQYQQLRNIHLDHYYTNSAASDFKDCLERFSAIQVEIFELKSAWVQVKNLIAKNLTVGRS